MNVSVLCHPKGWVGVGERSEFWLGPFLLLLPDLEVAADAVRALAAFGWRDLAGGGVEVGDRCGCD